MKAIFSSLVTLACLIGEAREASAQFNAIERISKNVASEEADDNSFSPSASASGLFITFHSDATNLVTNDTNDVRDVFLVNRSTGDVTLISQGLLNEPTDGESQNARISDDGAFVAYESTATNLINNDANDLSDIFLFTRLSGLNSLLSFTPAGDPGNGDSTNAAIDSDGDFVAFQSDATDLVTGDTNAKTDIFVVNRTVSPASIARVSITNGGIQGNDSSAHPSISNDGRYVVFESAATNLVFGDSNAKKDIFLYDRDSSAITRLSVSTNGTQADADCTNPVISGDGTTVAFQSAATNLVDSDTNGKTDIFVRNVSAATTSLVSKRDNGTRGDGDSTSPSISDDGRYILFESLSTNLVSGDTNAKSDLFIFDQTLASLARVSRSTAGAQLRDESTEGFITANGHYTTFVSAAKNLGLGTADAVPDVYFLNQECLITVAGITPTDTDGDSTNDCDEVCGADATKTSPGQCGCGNADTDSDSDGTADCIDVCPSDANKASAGTCGCGTSDADANGNTVADCLDPTTATKPNRLTLTRSSRRTLSVTIPNDFSHVTYTVRVKKGSQVVSTKSSTSRRLTFKNLSKGTYSVDYTVSVGGVTTLRSGTRRAKI